MYSSLFFCFPGVTAVKMLLDQIVKSFCVYRTADMYLNKAARPVGLGQSIINSKGNDLEGRLV